MNASLGLALALAGALWASPASADALPDARHPVPGPRVAAVHPHTASPAPRRIRRAHRHDAFALAAGPVYGREPRYYPGMGGASPNAGFGALAPVPVAVVGYREPYIGRGLIYNVPGEPVWSAGWSQRSDVISVKY